jgi:hypothetical protein
LDVRNLEIGFCGRRGVLVLMVPVVAVQNAVWDNVIFEEFPKNFLAEW